MGAVEHLQQAHVRGWLAPAGIPAPRLVEMFLAGSLQSVSATKQHGENGGCRHGGQGDGCGCSHRDGSDHSGGCCHGE
jgi:hypothetical protein